MTDELITGEVFGRENEAPSAYLQAQAQKPFAELLAPYEASHANLVAVLQGVSDAQARFKPGSGEGEDAWGIAQVIGHISGSEVRMAKRIRNLALGEEM